MLQRTTRVACFIEPCLPSRAKTPPAGADWLHEIKHDGFRILARRDAASVRLTTPIALSELPPQRSLRGPGQLLWHFAPTLQARGADKHSS
jgi:hypothetical protein